MNISLRVQPAASPLDEIAEALPQRAATLSRLFLSRADISPLEAAVLCALASGERRITELASRERATQPAITRLINRFEERGWVQREHDPDDGRAVLVALTPSGIEAHARLRAEYQAFMHEEIATLPPQDVKTLARAIEILDTLIERVTGRTP